MHPVCHVVSRIGARRFATAASATTSTSPAPPPPAAEPSLDQKVRKDAKLARKRLARMHGEALPRVTRRRQISNAQPKGYCRPIPVGEVPAYDEALKLISEDSIQLRSETKDVQKDIVAAENRLKSLRTSLEKLENSEETKDETKIIEAKSDVMEAEKDVNELRDKLGILRVQSQINVPSVRWKVRNAMVDMRVPVHRHLVEQRWRSEGDLDLLMERIHQMHVIPDIIPVMHPSLDLKVVYRTAREKQSIPQIKKAVEHNDESEVKELESSSELRRGRRKLQLIEPGVFLDPDQTIFEPKISTRVFHADTRLYTLIMVDPDVPDSENASFTTFLHWLQPNIQLSASTPSPRMHLFLENINRHTPYIPPHPQKGTPYHRYTILLLPQAPKNGLPYSPNERILDRFGTGMQFPPLTTGPRPTSERLDIPPLTASERRGFDVRGFIKEHGLNPALGGGAHMFREVWSPRVSSVYSEILGTEEPQYGRPPKVDPYEEKTSKYFS